MSNRNYNEPTMVLNNGTKRWYKDDKLHREDGPAIEYFNGDREWYVNGKLHREDGPAVEYINGCKEYWVHDKRYEKLPTKEEILTREIIE